MYGVAGRFQILCSALADYAPRYQSHDLPSWPSDYNVARSRHSATQHRPDEALLYAMNMTLFIVRGIDYEADVDDGQNPGFIIGL